MTSIFCRIISCVIMIKPSYWWCNVSRRKEAFEKHEITTQHLLFICWHFTLKWFQGLASLFVAMIDIFFISFFRCPFDFPFPRLSFFLRAFRKKKKTAICPRWSNLMWVSRHTHSQWTPSNIFWNHLWALLLLFLRRSWPSYHPVRLWSKKIIRKTVQTEWKVTLNRGEFLVGVLTDCVLWTINLEEAARVVVACEGVELL